MLLKRLASLTKPTVNVSAFRHDPRFGCSDAVTIMVYSLAMTAFTVRYEEGWRVIEKSTAPRYSHLDWNHMVPEDGNDGCYELVAAIINAIEAADNNLRRERK